MRRTREQYKLLYESQSLTIQNLQSEINHLKAIISILESSKSIPGLLASMSIAMERHSQASADIAEASINLVEMAMSLRHSQYKL